jgi:two-component sensor histidine kinase
MRILTSFPSPGIRLLMLASLLASLNISAQNPFIRHYTISDGLPCNQIFKIYQDSRKFLWLTTAAGVVRYDGSTFTTYGRKDGLSFSMAHNPLEDSFGRIWFRCPTGKLNFFYRNKFYNSSNAPFLDSIKKQGNFDHIFQDKDRNIYFYFGGSRTIYALDTNNRSTKLKVTDTHDKSGSLTKDGMRIYYMEHTLTGEILIWSDLGIYKTRNLAQPPVLVSSLDYWGLCPGENHTVFVKTSDSTTDKHRYVKYYNGSPVDSTELPGEILHAGTMVLEDISGLFWICTQDKGVFCYKHKQFAYHFDIKEARWVMQDHEKNIWISSLKGAYRISPYFLSSRQYDPGYFQNESIVHTTSDHDGGIWCTTGEKTWLLKNNTIYELETDIKTSPFNPIFGLENHGLILGKDFQYFVLRGIRVDPVAKKVYFKNKIRLPGVCRIAMDKTGNEFSAFNRSGEVVTYSLAKNIREINRAGVGHFYGNIFYNVNNNLVINEETNYILQGNKKIPEKDLAPFNRKIITAYRSINDSSELYMIENDSTFLICNHKLYNVTSALSDPFDLGVRGFKFHEPNMYYFSKGVIYVCDNFIKLLENRPLHLQLLDIKFQNICGFIIQNDSVYIGSDDGLTIIPERLLRQMKPRVPIPYFQTILVNDTVVDNLQQSISLTGKNRIMFGFGSINYSDSPVNFSYKLEGLDDAWAIGKGTNVIYQNLPRGDYIFKLKVRKATEAWSKPIEFKIAIFGHFWQHPLFFVLLSLLFTGLIALAIIRRKNFQIKRRELDHQLITLEQKALQSMMNPHFIFNSLGSIQNYLLQKKSGEAGLYLTQFARLIRQNLNAINSASINLEEEIDRLSNYLDLEKMRMENRFDYSIEVDENVDADELQIPSMIIQPFVENAIWHGIAMLKVQGEIVIRFHRHDDKSLDVIVEDNGIGMKRSETYSAKRETHLHLGMEMTRKRLEILGRKFSVKTCLNFSEMFPGNPNPGTRVEMVVPVGM